MIVLFSVHISLPRQWLHTWAENIYSIMCLCTENTVWESVCPSLLWSVGKYIRQKVRSKVQQCVLWLRCIIVKGTEHTHKHWVLMSALRFSLQCSTRWDPAESGPNACLTKKHLIHQHKHQTKRNQRPINTLSSTLACSLTCIKNCILIFTPINTIMWVDVELDCSVPERGSWLENEDLKMQCCSKTNK